MSEGVCDHPTPPHIARAQSSRLPCCRPFAPHPVGILTFHLLTDIHIQEAPLIERKTRKSVAFSKDNTIMDENGDISEAPHGDEDITTAVKHSQRTARTLIQILTRSLTARAASDPAVDEVTDMFAGLNKKKKKSSKPKAAEEGDGEVAAPAVTADGDFDASALKKKKKKAVKPKVEGVAPTDDFEAKLAEAGIEGAAADADETASAAVNGAAVSEEDGDLDAGTGIWAHNNTTPIPYPLLLHRFFALVNKYNPDILSSGSKAYKIPPPQCLREGNKKTIFANLADICKRIKRNDEHVIQFLFAELGTTGSVDGNKRLVIKGRFQQKQIENVLRRYIVEYVTCKTCRSPDTELSKGENRLYFVTCNSCGSRRSVTAIKSGFTAQVGKRKRLNG